MNLFSRNLLPVAVAFVLVTNCGLFGQTTTLSSSGSAAANRILDTQIQALFVVFHKEQISLASGYMNLVEAGASLQQIQAWKQSNASRFQAQAKRAQAMSLISARESMSASGAASTVSGTSSATAIFLKGKAALARAFIAERSQTIQSVGGALSAGQLAQADSLTLQEFIQQSGSSLDQQRQQAAALAVQTAASSPALPGPGAIPTGASPAVASFLSTRNQLMQLFAQFQKQYASAAPAARAIAFEQWQEQNVSLIQAYQNQAQNLAQASSRN